MGNTPFRCSGADIPNAAQPSEEYSFLSDSVVYSDYPHSYLSSSKITELIS